jgi:hypothetical protein
MIRSMTGSDFNGRHPRDIAGMLKHSGSAIDRAYIEQWASHFGVLTEWRSIVDRVGP